MQFLQRVNYRPIIVNQNESVRERHPKFAISFEGS